MTGSRQYTSAALAMLAPVITHMAVYPDCCATAAATGDPTSTVGDLHAFTRLSA